ncbi:MAG: LLM class flavin-dependent oxidoreductase [Candidatus Eremiobacteraeota bacterium]|nr:LLM class flavin-dependent oxidoreductase [Candidatus Eremiobacteraeota bacterium]MCW5866145.1 LLM class flavin-dependent oxidoreductase [Candidatus Eremiobacteraeota bacterium]
MLDQELHKQLENLRVVRFAVNLAPFGEWCDPNILATLAAEAEQAGWDGFFLWDHINWDRWGPQIGDPWIGLAAAALRTEHIKLGTMVTPVFRRRPTQLARQTTSLQQLCQGRLILGVGLGAPDPEESSDLGEAASLGLRAEMTDECLALLQRLWTGRPTIHRGKFYRLKTRGFLPRPPHPIPIWIAATFPFQPGPLARAARHQGLVPACFDRALTAAELAPLARPGQDLVAGAWTGDAPLRDRELVQSYHQAGVTWWLEPLDPWRAPLEELRRRLRDGPPLKGGEPRA